MTSQVHKDDFAKILRATDGAQVLIYKDNGEDGEPAIVVASVCDGVTAKMTISFKDTDSGYNTRNKSFDGFTQAQADNARGLVVKAVEENDQ